MYTKSTLTNAMLAVALLSTSAFAAAQTTPTTKEAMQQRNPEAAAQSKVDAKGPGVNKVAVQPEAMAPGAEKAKMAAEAKVAAKGVGPDKTAKQPEAMLPTSEKAKAAAEAKVAQKPTGVRKNRADEQMNKDAKKL